jgi:predicted restriction endonuclease
MRNGLAACPIHDAAFDQGYIAVGDFYGVLRSEILQESIVKHPGIECRGL